MNHTVLQNKATSQAIGIQNQTLWVMLQHLSFKATEVTSYQLQEKQKVLNTSQIRQIPLMDETTISLKATANKHQACIAKIVSETLTWGNSWWIKAQLHTINITQICIKLMSCSWTMTASNPNTNLQCSQSTTILIKLSFLLRLSKARRIKKFQQA